MLSTLANWPGAVPLWPHDFTNTPSFENLATRALPRPSATKMLPCASHATSVGRLKTSCGAPAPERRRRGRRRLRRRRPAAGARRILNRFRLPSEEKRDAALRIELHHHRGHLVDDPDVVLRIDANLRGEQEPVDSLADLARELPVAIELEQPRAAVRERTRRRQRHRRMAGARVDEDVAARIGRHAADFAEIDVVGQRQRHSAPNRSSSPAPRSGRTAASPPGRLRPTARSKDALHRRLLHGALLRQRPARRVAPAAAAGCISARATIRFRRG